MLLLTLIIARSAVLKSRGINVSAKAKKNESPNLILYFIFILVVVLFISEIFRPTFKFSFHILPDWMITPLANSVLIKAIGVLLQLFALVMLLLTLLHFKDSLRFGMDSEHRGKLITNGIFSISRNPFFISLLLFFMGNAFLISSPFFIAFTLSAIISIHLFILKEEKFMQKNYGEEYKKYSQRVRRYF